MYFYVNEFQVGVNDSIFSGNEHQKVYYNFSRIVKGYVSKFAVI